MLVRKENKIVKKEATLDLTSDYGKLYDEYGDPEDVAEELGNKVVKILKKISSRIDDAVNNSYSVDEFLTNMQFLLDGIRGDFSKKYPLGRMYNLAGGSVQWSTNNPWIEDYSKKFINVVSNGAGNLFDSFSIEEEEGSVYGYGNPPSRSNTWLIFEENFDILRGHNKEDIDNYDLQDVGRLIGDRISGKGWECKDTYRGFTICEEGWYLAHLTFIFNSDSNKLTISCFSH